MVLRHILAAGAIAGLAAASAGAARAQEPIVLKFAYPGPLQSTPATVGVEQPVMAHSNAITRGVFFVAALN